MRHFVASLVGLIALAGLGDGSDVLATEDVRLPRALYWDYGQAYIPPGYSSRTAYLDDVGVSEVHIWLNDNDWDSDHKGGGRCQLFSYTDSHGNKRWEPATLRTFIRELKRSGRIIVLTLSPQMQRTSYIASLSQADGPLSIAREFKVPVELDIESNWPDKNHL